MSNPDEHSDAPKPVVKDKNPHNYRKVGYSMIVISVSLVLIGLLVWAIGDNYHFSSDIMANQEIDAMTPKHGFNLVFYDTQQPVGAKLKLLDSASTIDDAQQKQIQYAQQNPSPLGKVLIFNGTLQANKQLVLDTVAAITQYQADLAKAQAAKAAAASQAPVVPVNQTTPSTKQNTTSSNSTVVASSNIPKAITTNVTKTSTNATVVTTNVTKTISNATAVTLHNNTKSIVSLGQNSEKMKMSENMTNTSNMTNNTSSTTTKSPVTNVTATQTHQKSISISESMGITAK